ncbi:hypothetical protein [Nannocystis bainbridge]|uniref:hypothetical protein n=1 Tax=Nannocystis bainbridge TaxID=2995303 RepID=UPI0023310F80|nr:hypothetical protein [Nannocystis bainbridge]
MAALFSVLLSGCYPPLGNCSATYEDEIEMTPEEFAEFQHGGMPVLDGDTTAGPTTSAGATDASTTDASTTDASTTDASTTDASTTDTTGGVVLSDEETCQVVCQSVGEEHGALRSCEVAKAPTKVTVTCVYPAYCEGRRHASVASRGHGSDAEAAAAWLARAAHDEAASVHAFHALAQELAGLGAPAELLARIDAAAADEVRHARVVADAARARGAEVTPPACVAVAERDLLAIAVENAVEGCVRETWAALSAAHQARFAAEPAMRSMYVEIAADEARHAELAWAIDAWLMGQLDVAGRAEVAAARQAAIAELDASLQRLEVPALQRLGVPSAAVATRLCAELDAALWSRAA